MSEEYIDPDYVTDLEEALVELAAHGADMTISTAQTVLIAKFNVNQRIDDWDEDEDELAEVDA